MKCFLIEDSPVIRERMISLLQESTPFKIVAHADTEESAINWLQSHEWDLAVIDLNLKQGSGLNVLQSLQMRHPDGKRIVLTNYASPEIRRKCIDLGADAFFDKSTEVDELIEYLNSLSKTL